MKYLLFLFFMIFLDSSSAGLLPPWIEGKSKLHAFEQLIEWSNEIKPYTISGTTTKEEKSSEGVLTQKIEINLTSKDCAKQKLTSSCLPVGLHTLNPALFCNMTLQNCAGSKLSKVLLIK